MKSIYNRLIALGAKVVHAPTWHRARQKASGYMWTGDDAVLEYNNMEFHFKMWHHGGDDMNEEQAQDALSLKGIERDGKYYDLCWHSIRTENAIWLHSTGWFGANSRVELGKTVERIRSAVRTSDNHNLTEQQEVELRNSGFEKIL